MRVYSTETLFVIFLLFAAILGSNFLFNTVTGAVTASGYKETVVEVVTKVPVAVSSSMSAPGWGDCIGIGGKTATDKFCQYHGYARADTPYCFVENKPQSYGWDWSACSGNDITYYDQDLGPSLAATKVHCLVYSETNCGDGLDNDGDGANDCKDIDCDNIAGSGGTCEYNKEKSCEDNFDNDKDTLVDCKDPDCNSVFVRNSYKCETFESTCNDGFDNDDDQTVDCKDTDCAGKQGQGAICGQVETLCNDGNDNDGNGLIDCKDPGCNGRAGIGGVCQTAEKVCSDGFDNDADGKKDCKDFDCNNIDSCQFSKEITCNDELDNDADNFVDCKDLDCNGKNSCQFGSETSCNDNIDNDEDGATDCADNNCLSCGSGCACQAGQKVELICYDGLDNDNDGDADCLDSDCANNNLQEVCDDKDNNCNGQIDEDLKKIVYKDADSDKYGNPSVSTNACVIPKGYVNNSLDCSDNNPLVTVAKTFYQDLDSDGFGDVNDKLDSCTKPVGYVNNSLDCDDGDAAVNNSVTFYLDLDKDGFGNLVNKTQACTAPLGYVDNGKDCNDFNSTINPDNAEVCNGIDDNCNRKVDENFDLDSDGYVDKQTVACTIVYNTSQLDCDEFNANVNPGAAELCIGDIDENCNDQVNENCTVCGNILDNTVGRADISCLGNNVCEPGETPENAPQDCGCSEGQQLVNSTCQIVIQEDAQIECGNNVAEAGEQCDGSDDLQCPGACSLDCSCPFVVEDGVCDKAAGETKENSPQDCAFKLEGLIIVISIISALAAVFAIWYFKFRPRQYVATQTEPSENGYESAESDEEY